jgi:hypothetical protein
MGLTVSMYEDTAPELQWNLMSYFNVNEAAVGNVYLLVWKVST